MLLLFRSNRIAARADPCGKSAYIKNKTCSRPPIFVYQRVLEFQVHIFEESTETGVFEEGVVARLY